MRWCAGHEIDARMRLAGQSLEEAADHVVQKILGRFEGSGGLIAVGADGSISMPFNSEGMYRGSVREGGEKETAIYR